jgi:hypothetical protein
MKVLNLKPNNQKQKIALFSLEYSIPLGEDMNWHMPSPILAYLFLIFLAKLCIFANLLW